MALFGKKTTDAPKAAIGAARGLTPGGLNPGASMIDKFTFYTADPSVEAALQVPTISRARDLICSMVGCLTLRQFTYQWNGERMERIYLPPDTWTMQPDPNVTRNFIMANTASDLLMFGRAFWAITERFGNGFPSAFTWLPSQNVYTLDQSGPQWFGPSNEITFQGAPLETNDVVQFLSPNGGLIYQGVSAITTTLRLQRAAERFATNEIAAGYLQQKGGEPMSGDELGEMAAAWAANRRTNSIGALNEFVEFKTFDQDPSKLQLVEARKYAALELARLTDIPGYLLGIDQSGMTYMNAQQARQDLILFGARPLLHAIEERLSMDDILPRGRHVQFDVDEYVEDFMMDESDRGVVNEPSPRIPEDEMDLE